MSRNLAIKHIRTTKANLDSQASASGLNQGEIYLITDENRIAVGLSATTYETFAKESEAGGGSLDINSLTAKTTPVDADITVIEDSAASWAQKKLSWANIKATLKTYFDTLYVALTGNQTVAGIKTFSSFPVTPSSAPTTDYQVANKKYVDDNAGGGGATIDFSSPVIELGSNSASGNSEFYTPMSLITGINVPTMLIFDSDPIYSYAFCWGNTSNSWVGAKKITQFSGAGNRCFVAVPGVYYGFQVYAELSGSLFKVIDPLTFNVIDSVTYTWND